MTNVIQRFAIFLTLLLSFTVLVNVVKASPSAQIEDGLVYAVQADDWLSKLADKFYGDPSYWRMIQRATNRKAAQDHSFALIDNPDLIEVGQKLWIPFITEPTGFQDIEQVVQDGTWPNFTWVLLTEPDLPVHTISFHPTQDQVLYIGVGKEIQMSRDSGYSWQTVAGDLPEFCSEWGTIMVNPVRPNELYAYVPGTSIPSWPDSCPAILARSDDDGRNWTLLKLPDQTRQGDYKEVPPESISLYFHPQTGDLYARTFWPTTLPGRGGAIAILKSSDAGQTWEPLSAPPYFQTLLGFQQTEDGLALYSLAQDTYYLLSGTAQVKLYRLLAEQTDWEEIALPESSRVYPQLSGADHLYVGIASSEAWAAGELDLYQVTDTTARRVGRLPDIECAFSNSLRNDQDNVLFWTQRSDDYGCHTLIDVLHFSQDGGQHWQKLKLPQLLAINDVEIRRSLNGDYATLYVASNQGLWAYRYEQVPLSE